MTSSIRLTAQQTELLGGLSRPHASSCAEEPERAKHSSRATKRRGLRRRADERSSSATARVSRPTYGRCSSPRASRSFTCIGLMRDLIEEAGLQDTLPAVEAARPVRRLLPRGRSRRARRCSTASGRVDALVVDEGQDLLKPPCVLVLDALLVGELDGWNVATLPRSQPGHLPRWSPGELERLESVATCYRLTQNCRNTREIAMATSILSGVAVSETLVAEGPGRDRALVRRSRYA